MSTSTGRSRTWVSPNDNSTWHRSSDWLHPDVRTVFELVGEHALPRVGGAPRTASVDEAIDRGADYLDHAPIRDSGQAGGAGGLGDRLPDPRSSPFLADPAHLADDYFSWGVQVDDLGLTQMRQLYARYLS